MADFELLGAIKNKMGYFENQKRFERQTRARESLSNKIHLLHEVKPSRLAEVAISSNAQKQKQSQAR